MINLQDFIAKYNGQREMFDNESYRGECTQIVKRWAQANGWPIPNSNGTNKAADYRNFLNGYVFIANTIEGKPEPGDIVVWDKLVAGGYGHVAIYVGGDLMRLDVFEQNWPKGTPCHLQQNSYSNVAGWLHPTTPAKVDVPIVEAPQATQTIEIKLNVPRYQFNRNLYPGLMADQDVVALQIYLKALNFYPKEVNCTGNYLAITKKAVANYQVQNKILPSLNEYGSGYFGPKTRAFINK